MGTHSHSFTLPYQPFTPWSEPADEFDADLHAWIISTGHWHLREQTQESFECAREAHHLDQHLKQMKGVAR